jgi:hypothetical protein
LLLLGPPTHTANAIVSATPNESRCLSNSTGDISKRTDELSNQRSRACLVQFRGSVDDSYAVRFTDTGEVWVLFDDTWRKVSRPAQVICYETAVLTEAEYRKLFGSVPPLPSTAFHPGGWSSPRLNIST